MEQLDLKGIWWLPGKADNQVSGNLSFNVRNRIVLELNGSFKSYQELNQAHKYDIILGITSNGKKVSLTTCYEVGSSLSFPGYASVSFQSRYIL